MYWKRSLLHGIITAPLIVGTLGAFAAVMPWMLVPTVILTSLFWLWRYHRVALPATAVRMLAPHLAILMAELGPWCLLFTLAQYGYAQAVMRWAPLVTPFYGLAELLAALAQLTAFMPVLMLVNFGAPLIAVMVLAVRRKAVIRWSPLATVSGLALVALGTWYGAGQYQHHLRYIDRVNLASGVNTDEYLPFAKHSRLVRVARPTVQLTGQLPRLDGATAAYPVYAGAAQALYPRMGRTKIDQLVQLNQTDAAYDNLVHKRCEVVFAFKPSPAELQAAKQAGVTFHYTPIAREAFIFFVSHNNVIKGLTTSQIQAIYQRKITNWHALGGHLARIRAFQRPANSGSQTVMQALVMRGQKMARPLKAEEIDGMGGILASVADYENGPNDLGYSFRFYTQGMQQTKDLRVLKVDGVAPTTQTIESGRYPYTLNLYAVTTGHERPQVRQLLTWLQSEQGQALVRQTGYVPIAR
ncbi:PstS family phosphate ABC transporter substrate-binding protein [Lacticaseibacillus absianus]|uniref:PstS family phosphate ABC transporter substrate-binding protein n=1 Tax=Lacticaseibacillus absianus TaxID=2729623 RepID=UPI0015CA167B|nr:substrate-binding domain-containing protein [Lacticaseibacillus absianus]